MLAIRMQRTGRKGHAMFRVVVQDSRFTPTSGRVVANVGSYDPHSKTVVINKDKIVFYLDHGAQPSDRVVKLLVSEGVKLPDWVEKPVTNKKRAIRNVEKLRRNRPEEPKEETKADEVQAESAEKPVEDETAGTAGSETTDEAATSTPKVDSAKESKSEES